LMALLFRRTTWHSAVSPFRNFDDLRRTPTEA
jgi:hypothetical protein